MWFSKYILVVWCIFISDNKGSKIVPPHYQIIQNNRPIKYVVQNFPAYFYFYRYLKLLAEQLQLYNFKKFNTSVLF